MKIAIVMAHCSVHNSTSGAVKAIFNLANYLALNNEVLVIYNDCSIGDPFYSLQAKKTNLKTNLKINFLYKVFREVIRGLQKVGLCNNNYDPVTEKKQKVVGLPLSHKLEDFRPNLTILGGISDISSLQEVKSSEVEGRKVILMCHSNVSQVFSRLSNREKKALTKATYIQVLLPDHIKYLNNICDNEVVCIGNSVPQFDKYCDNNSKRIIYLSRVDKNKQHDKLIRAFSLIDISIREGWTIAWRMILIINLNSILTIL